MITVSVSLVVYGDSNCCPHSPFTANMGNKREKEISVAV